MPASDVLRFTDPDEYAAAEATTPPGAGMPSRIGKPDLTILGRGTFNAQLTRIFLHRLRVREMSESLPRIGFTATAKSRISLSYRIEPGPSTPLFWSGMEVPANGVMLSAGQDAFFRSPGAARAGYLGLSAQDFASIAPMMAGRDLTTDRLAPVFVPPPLAFARLRRLHATAIRLAEQTPDVIASPEAAFGLEQALLEAMIDCLCVVPQEQERSAQGRHATVMRRFRNALDENSGRAVHFPQLCAAIGVSGRTLRRCCEEHLGVSPKRYLLMRRMQLVRRALRESAGTGATVTQIATRYGFFDLSHFAGQYHAYFGEIPTATLRAQRQWVEAA